MNPLVTERLILPFIINFFLVFGAVGFALGTALILKPAGVMQFFQAANRWVSMRTRTKWLEVPRDTQVFWQRHRLPLGVAATLLGLFSVFVLLTRVDAGRVAGLIDSRAPLQFVAWIVESVLLFLIAGNMLAAVVGMLLLFSPTTLGAIEARANSWYSTRRHSRGAETRYMALDRLTESRPRAMGWAVAAGSLLVIIQFGVMLAARS